MKIAVCVSGVPRSGIGASQEVNKDFPRNLKNLRRNFPTADVYVGTWAPYEELLKKELPNEPYKLFDEPKSHYHPYLDMPKVDMVSDKMRKFSDIYKSKPDLHERTRHQSKQIMCHANMVNSLPQDYDVIVRARFDTFTYTNAKFDQYVQAVYNKKIPIGFACLKPHWATFNKVVELNDKDENRDRYLFDSLIIHHRSNLDPKYVFDLYEKQKLCPAEFGWFQALSLPNGSKHRCISGWVNADRCVLKNFLDEAK